MGLRFRLVLSHLDWLRTRGSVRFNSLRTVGGPVPSNRTPSPPGRQHMPTESPSWSSMSPRKHGFAYRQEGVSSIGRNGDLLQYHAGQRHYRPWQNCLRQSRKTETTRSPLTMPSANYGRCSASRWPRKINSKPLHERPVKAEMTCIAPPAVSW
jgi:hypothetical protein